MATIFFSKNEVKSNLRRTYLIYIVAVIFLGLASQKYSPYLPLFLAKNAGDALWAMMVYYGFRFLLVRKHILLSLLFSLLFSFSIEFSQLYQAEWANQIRSTWYGALVFGKGFLFVDLIRYMVGIFIASFFDHFILKNQQR